jgi:hypothetical protein
MRKAEVGELGLGCRGPPPVFLDVWQTKDFKLDCILHAKSVLCPCRDRVLVFALLFGAIPCFISTFFARPPSNGSYVSIACFALIPKAGGISMPPPQPQRYCALSRQSFGDSIYGHRFALKESCINFSSWQDSFVATQWAIYSTVVHLNFASRFKAYSWGFSKIRIKNSYSNAVRISRTSLKVHIFGVPSAIPFAIQTTGRWSFLKLSRASLSWYQRTQKVAKAARPRNPVRNTIHQSGFDIFLVGFSSHLHGPSWHLQIGVSASPAGTIFAWASTAEDGPFWGAGFFCPSWCFFLWDKLFPLL